MAVATFPSIQPLIATHSTEDDKGGTTDRLSSDVREHGNPAVPGHPGDLKNCDLTATEAKLLGVMYASDD